MRFQQLEEVYFELREETANEAVLTWSARPSPDNRTSVFLNNELIPDGRFIISITAPGMQPQTRLLEFRAANR